MLLPRTYKYTSDPAATTPNEKSRRRSSRRSLPAAERRPATQQPSPLRMHTEPVAIPSAKPTHAPSAASTREPAGEQRTMSGYSTTSSGSRRKKSSHDPNALSPAVAALLAVTSIPPRKPNRYRSRPGADRHISIEELVQGWKSDDSLKSNNGSSPLSILLEDAEDFDVDDVFTKGSVDEPSYLNHRSCSSDSMPSLDSDDRSIRSSYSPSTPGSLRSRPSYQNLKERPRSLPVSQECAQDHPLVPRSQPEDETSLLPVDKKRVPATKPRSSLKSNLTTSLQSLKKAAVDSISSFSRAATATPGSLRVAAPPIDEMLWSHPFLFPRFSPEIRPYMEGIPSEAERRYLNPMPLTFEEQEAPFQQALHAPYLAEVIEDAPTIQMQTYNRGRRRAGGRRGAPNPNSEAGRALFGEGVRQREVRENPDFLRVVVLEMNMRREGKLEQGKAKIWLPPRQVSAAPEQTDGKRWVGVSAY